MPVGADGVENYANTAVGTALGVSATGGVSGASTSAIAVPITTANFTASQFKVGFSGSLADGTKNASRIYFRASLTRWCGWVTGTAMTLSANDDSAAHTGMIEVSYDGGAFSSASYSAGVYTLFTGLSQARRFVVLRINAAFGNAGYILNSGNVSSVTGQSPNIEPYQYWSNLGVPNGSDYSNCMTVANAANYSPRLAKQANTTTGGNCASIKLRGAFTSIAVMSTGSTKIGFWAEGDTAATFYACTAGVGKVITGLSGTSKTYQVWDSSSTSADHHLCVSGDAAQVDVGFKGGVLIVGDSLVAADQATAAKCENWSFSAWAQLGRTVCTAGVAGHTVAQTDTLISNVLPMFTFGANDVAMISTGRNSVTSNADAFSQAEIDSYQSCITRFKNAGASKIIGRAILPNSTGSFTWTAGNASISDLVTAQADATIMYMPTSTWIGWTSSEASPATHPDGPGNAFITPFEKAALAALGF